MKTKAISSVTSNSFLLLSFRLLLCSIPHHFQKIFFKGRLHLLIRAFECVTEIAQLFSRPRNQGVNCHNKHLSLITCRLQYKSHIQVGLFIFISKAVGWYQRTTLANVNRLPP